jgi:hypothetical protein
VPKQLPLPGGLSEEGWKVKIRDRERVEPPHATVIRGQHEWRWDLRARRFMNREPDPRDVPDEILSLLALHHVDLARMWDETHPDNPVGPREEE